MGAATSRVLTVAAASPYRVEVGPGLLATLPGVVTEESVAILSDEQVAGHHGAPARRAVEAHGKHSQLLLVPAGERSKSLERYGELLRRLSQLGFDRSLAVVAIGGGVVSDLAGFVAATYLRGVAFYACPTSLLAMVDASVGGKTGINLPEGKNLVGAFWQPRHVLVDVSTLATLPEREFRQGAVELFKHGLLGDESLLGAIRDPAFRPDGDSAVLTRYIADSVAVKARVVAEDEREQGGRRAHLNLGHTLAHALEAASGHDLSHGDAVAYGLLFASLVGSGRGWHDFTAEALELLRYLSPAGLPTREYDALLPYMLRDKKNVGARQRFVLLLEPHRPALVDDVSLEEQRSAWRRLLEVMA